MAHENIYNESSFEGSGTKIRLFHPNHHHDPPWAVKSLTIIALSDAICLVISTCFGTGKSSKILSSPSSRMPLVSGRDAYSFRTILSIAVSLSYIHTQGFCEIHEPEGFRVQSCYVLHIASQLALEKLQSFVDWLIDGKQDAQRAIDGALWGSGNGWRALRSRPTA